MTDIFISYSSDDRARARQFADAFEAEGLSVWWDAGLRAGDAYDQKIEQALKSAKAVVVLWSKTSVESRWVRAEATLADRARTLVPCMIEPCDRPIMFELTHTVELAHWQGDRADKSWQALLGDVQRYVGREAEPEEIAITMPEPPPRLTGERGSAPSLAVLPFTNRSQLAEDDILAEGMVEDLIAALAQGVFVRVLGSMTTANLSRATISEPAALGRRLGVRYLLEGNMRRVANNLRVTTQLIEAESGEVLSAGRFDRRLDELAELQEELVHEVAGSLDTQVMNLEVARVLRKPGDLTAWEAAMRCISYASHLDAASLAKGLEEGRRAVEIDPEYALGHAALANCSAVLYLLAFTEDPSQVKLIRRHIDRALELAPNDAFVLTYAGAALVWSGQLEESLRPLARAIAKMPGNGMAQFCYSSACSFLDRTKEAQEHGSLAVRLMPGSPMFWAVNSMQANTAIRLGRWEDAIAWLDESLMLNPDASIIRLQQAICYRHFGRHGEAQAAFERVCDDGWTLAQMELWFRRIMSDNPALDEHLESINALWAKAERSA